jgi:tannase/feruloyl esterase
VTRILTGGLCALMLAAAANNLAAAEGTSCETLASLKLPDTTITLARAVEAGTFAPPASGVAQTGGLMSTLPAFCRVAATLKPTSDSDIKVEVWLPAAGWNGKLQAVGNGGWAGTISYSAMAQALRRGYATTSTDTGHSEPGGAFTLGHPEKFIDFAYRSEHEMTVTAKAVVNAYYGSAPKYSYWNGCSTGGRQGLIEVQRYPNDFDGVIAGAQANPRTHLNAWQLSIAQAALSDPAAFIPREKYPAIHRAVLNACDGLDGVKDGLIGDPTRCHFDPQVIGCGKEDGRECLTARQVETARTIMRPAKTSRGEEVFPGYAPGTELGWGAIVGGPEPTSLAIDHYKYVVFKDANWDWRTFNIDRDVAVADKVDGGTINAVDPNIQPFTGHGGKLLLYHGWADPLVAPGTSINYYNSVAKALGGRSKTGASVRLFMVPGMGHCGGGAGPNTFDSVTALERWVEQGQAPDQMVASHSTNGVVDRTRPLCPYPQVAVYQGTGSTDDAANFACRTRE